MTQLIIALAAFLGTHFLMSHPLRATLVKSLGAGAFAGVYSLVALATFGWVIWAFHHAPITTPLWLAGDGLWWVASVLMLFGAILFVGSVAGNPALPRPDAGALAKAPARGVFGITRHPMMWGFALWALVHALVAPNQATLILSAGIAILALGGSLGQDRKKAVLMGEGWRDWAARTSFAPFGNQIAGKASWKTAWPGRTAVLAGVALWLIATYLHPRFGLPVAGIWRWMGF
jgi:uncharacterized membrane protein